MHERCDCCGKQTAVLEIFFNGHQFLCPECTIQRVARHVSQRGK